MIESDVRPFTEQRPEPVPVGRAPRRFRVLAVMPVFNEQDLVAGTVSALLNAGIEVHVVDHWSTDRTLERVQGLGDRPRLRWERFPADGPRATYAWASLLERLDAVAAESSADWCIYHPADERRHSPWPGVCLRDALFHVQELGYNAVDHARFTFRLVDHGFLDGDDPETHFRYFSPEGSSIHTVDVSAWRNEHRPVGLAAMAGHEVIFAGRRVCPYRFVLAHYPIRSQSQGERKLRDRALRWDRREWRRGWPLHDDHVSAEYVFRWDPKRLSDVGGVGGSSGLVPGHGEVPRVSCP
jgi:glycosyltransferase involved in cell wall biosynthesis